MKVEAKTPFVILANWVDVLASLTQVKRWITILFKIKLITTMTKEIEPPNAAPKSFEKEYALQM